MASMKRFGALALAATMFAAPLAAKEAMAQDRAEPFRKAEPATMLVLATPAMAAAMEEAEKNPQKAAVQIEYTAAKAAAGRVVPSSDIVTGIVAAEAAIDSIKKTMGAKAKNCPALETLEDAKASLTKSNGGKNVLLWMGADGKPYVERTAAMNQNVTPKALFGRTLGK